MGKGGNVNSSESANTQFVDSRAKAEFKAAGWYKFLKKFSGENVAISQAFIETFDGEKVKIGSQTFNITETIIARETHTSATGDSWHKNNKTLLKVDANVYLKPEHEHIGWTPTIHISYFKPEWKHVITTFQHYIICEGRFFTVHKYQMRFLVHISGAKPMNLPFFLHRSLL